MTQSIKKWFTLIEMLIVIVIIGILAWVLIPKIGWAKDKANDVAKQATVRGIASSLLQYDMDNNEYPTGTNLDWFLSGAMAEKWNFTALTETWDYSFVTTGHKFLFCAKLSKGNEGWNSTSGANDATWNNDLSNRSAKDTGNYYCYKG